MRNGHKPSNKHALRDKTDRAVKMADQRYGVEATPRKNGNGRGAGTASVEPVMPDMAARVPMIPSATMDPIRSGGNFAPFRPAPKPVPGMVPGYEPGAEIIGEAQWGGTGTPITAGFLTDLGEYNAELFGRSSVQTYEKMRRGDAQVWGTLMAVKGPLQSATWDVEPGVKANEPGYAKAREVAEFVKDNLFGGLEFQTSSGGWHSQAWDTIMWNALLCLDFGCAVHEDVYRVDGNDLKLRALVPLLPITYYRWHPEIDGYTLLALEQYGYRGIEFINATVPAEKICRFTLNQEGSNYWGMSLLRSAYPHWYIKNQLYRIDAIAAERNGLGVPVITLAKGASAQDRAVAFEFVSKLSAHELTGLVLPAESTFKIEGVSGTPRDLAKTIEHHNRMISTTALAMFMTIGSAPHGSRATAATQHDFFLAASQHLATYIGDRMTTTTVRRLTEYNFGENAICPRLVAKNVKMRDFEDVRKALQELAGVGLLVSDEPLRNHIRDEYELPVETDEGVVTNKGEQVQEAGGEVAGAGPQPGADGSLPKPKKPGDPMQPANKEDGQRAKQKKGVPGKKKQPDDVGNSMEASDVVLLTDVDQPTIFFIRHGETPDDENPEEEKVSSWSDIGLTEKGREQKRKDGERLKGKGITEIYASSLPRCIESAKIIADIIGAEVIEDYGLRGWRLPWAGESVNSVLPENNPLAPGAGIAHTISRKIKDEIQWYEDHPDKAPPGGDTWNRTEYRIADAIDRATIRAETLGKPIAVLTHSRILNSLPDLSRGTLCDGEEDSSQAAANLEGVSKAVRRPDGTTWDLTYNAKTLSEVGGQIIVAQPRNRSGSPTQRRTQKKSPDGPPSDSAQEAHPSAGTPELTPVSKKKAKPSTDAGAKQAQHGARIVHEKEHLVFKPSASQERDIAVGVPVKLQPEDKQDTPLNPTPDKTPTVKETFFQAGSRSVKAIVGKKEKDGSMVVQTIIFPKPDWKSRSSVKSWLKSHSKKSKIDETGSSYRARQQEPGGFLDGTMRTIELNSETMSETADNEDDRLLFQDHHGEGAAEDLRGHYTSIYNQIVQKITGPIKAKVIAHVAKEAARQLNAKVPVTQLHFSPDHRTQGMLDDLVEKMHAKASEQAKKEVRAKRKKS